MRNVKRIESILKDRMIIFSCTNAMFLFLLLPIGRFWIKWYVHYPMVLYHHHVLMIWRITSLLGCSSDDWSSFISGVLQLMLSYRWFISSSLSHRFHPYWYGYIVNLMMIASNQSANSRILQSWYKVTSSSSPVCIIDILKRFLNRCCAVFTNGIVSSRHCAIAPSLIQVNCYLSKKDKYSWILFHIFQYTS